MKNVYLLDLKVNGIKNIEKPVEIHFYKKTLSQDLDTYHYNVKAIYGENGVGKSGIITAVKIIKELMINRKYLYDSLNQVKLKELINKKEKKLNIEINYLVRLEESVFYHNYIVVLDFDEHEKEYFISYEKLSGKNKINQQSIQTIFEVNNGKVKDMYCTGSMYNIINDFTKNLLTKSSLVSLFYLNYHSFDQSIMQKEDRYFYFYALCAVIFGNNIFAFLEEEDKHESYAMQSFFEKNDMSFINEKYLSSFVEDINFITPNSKSIKKQEIHKFEKEIKKLTKFINIFKPELENIVIDKKENKDEFICDLYFDYGDYKIHSEFESTGIKKLMRLFTAFQLVEKGGVVFIDELDSNIHDVYLCKLLEYFTEYSAGQLCFTTHNMGPMSILKKSKKSIDFLSRDNVIVPWISNGNYSVENLYKNGMIEKSPFNLDSTDFIGMFDVEL